MLRMVFTSCAASELPFDALREVLARERQRALSRGKPGRAQQRESKARTGRLLRGTL